MELDSCPRCGHDQAFPERIAIQCRECLVVIIWAEVHVPGEPDSVQPVMMAPRDYVLRVATAMSKRTRWGRQHVPMA